MNRRLALALLSSLFIALPAAPQEAVQAAAERARVKIESIVASGDEPRDRQPAATRTVLSEAEVNAYLQVHGPGILPPGIADPNVRLGDDGRVRARAIVNLDEVRKSRSRAWNDPLAYAVGSVEVIAAGAVSGDGGMGRMQFESATVAGVSVPKSVVQELLRFYTVTPERPEGVDLDEPFPLPAEIVRVIVQRGHATLVQ